MVKTLNALQLGMLCTEDGSIKGVWKITLLIYMKQGWNFLYTVLKVEKQ